MSNGKPDLANHIIRFICTTFRFAILSFGRGSTQAAVVHNGFLYATVPDSPPTLIHTMGSGSNMVYCCHFQKHKLLMLVQYKSRTILMQVCMMLSSRV